MHVCFRIIPEYVRLYIYTYMTAVAVPLQFHFAFTGLPEAF